MSIDTSASRSTITPKIDPEYAALIPALSEGEYDALVESIREHGLLQAIVVNRDGIVLDGHSRLRACEDAGVPPRFVVKSFPSRMDEATYAIEANVLRRHLGAFRRVEVALKLEPQEIERAKIRRLSKLKNVKDAISSLQIIGNDAEHEEVVVSGEVAAILGRKAGVSAETFRQARFLLRNAPEEMLFQLRLGELSIHSAYMRLREDSGAAATIAAATRHNRAQIVKDGQDVKATEKRGRIVVLPATLYDKVVDIIVYARALGASKVEFSIEHRTVVSIADIQEKQ